MAQMEAYEGLAQIYDIFMDEMKSFRDILEKEDTQAMKEKFIQSTQRRKYFDIDS